MHSGPSHFEKHQISDFIMENAVIQTLKPGFLFETHLHHTIELFICLSGQLTIHIQNRDVLVHTGDYFLCFPNFPHSGGTAGTEPCTILQIHFHCRLPQDAFAPVGTAGYRQTSLFDFEVMLAQRQYMRSLSSIQLEGCVRGIYEEYLHPQANGSCLLFHYLQILNLLLSRELTQMNAPDAQSINRYLYTACIYIKQHYTEHLSVTAVAEVCGISPRYLSKLFHDHLQISVCSYITHVRISQGIQIMRKDPDYPMIKLALDLGFSSQQHFSSVFKEVMAMSPKRYFSLHQVNQ